MTVWDSLRGQDAAASLLRRAAASASPAHAWLLVGPAGSGRSIAARAFAATLQCATQTGCGACEACREVLAGSHPDVQVVATSTLSYGVEAMRSLVPAVQSRPATGRVRVIVIEDADRLTDSAANVLLKPLEEPGVTTVMVLCAPAVVDVLPTIRSRCAVVGLRLPLPEEIADLLVGEGTEPELAAFVAATAQGHVGRARRLARDPDARARRAAVLKLPRELRTISSALAAASELVQAAEDEASAEVGEVAARETAELKEALGVGVRGVSPRGTAGPLKELEAQQKSRTTRAKRDVLDRALVDLAALYRDALVVQFGAESVAGRVHPDQAATVQAIAGTNTPEAVLRCIEAVLRCREAIAANVAPQLACEAMALSLRAAAA